MKIWAIGDLHLSFGVKNKSMDLFGPLWENHAARLQTIWESCISQDDLVLIPGDISWAMKLDDAMQDLIWLDTLPGTKVLIKGNHDLWWDSLSKLRKALPPSIHVIQNDIFSWHNRVFVGGARLWDTDEYSFDNWIDFVPRESLISSEPKNKVEENKVIFRRELTRLEESLKKLPQNLPKNVLRIAMTHYPPIGPDLLPSNASVLFTKYNVSHVVFGHLHALKEDLRKTELFGISDGVQYTLTSCDWLSCTPILIYNLSL